MGVYLSTPNTELEGTQDGKSSKLVFGAASMQGWRVGQEDAHIAIADYDTDTSLFGVFDGHGGPEVAKYCAQYLPEFIKSLNSYQNNQLIECLEEAFLKFDKSLTLNEVIQELKLLSANPEVDNDDNDTDDDINEAILLREEADLPISEVMKRYNSEPIPVPESECGSSTNSSRAGLSLPLHMRSEMKERTKPVSPFLRAKRSSNNEYSHQKDESEPQPEQQSSSSKVEVTSSSSSSNAIISESMNTSEYKTENAAQLQNESGVTSESTAEEPIQSSNGVKESDSSQVSNGEIDSQNDGNDVKSSTPSIETDLSDDKNEKRSESDSITNSSENDRSFDSTPSETPYKGKGKYKKIVTPKTVIADSTSKSETPEKPIYEYFLKDFDEEDEESEDDSEEFEGNDESSDEELDDNSDSEEDEEEGEENTAPPCFERPGYDSGCTAVVALFKGNQLVVANAGDSRCVVSRDGEAIDMSVDHKPEDDIERERITKAGGKVTRDGRVNGGLNLSRAIGDHAYKQNKVVSDRDQMITALPDIKTLEINPKTDEFMVIACDGIWNSMTSQQVIDFVGQRIQKTIKLSTICDELFRACLAPNTHGDGTGCDNMTAVIVKFLSANNLKRKIDENDGNSNENDIDSTQTIDESIVSEEPQMKRNKSEDTDVVHSQSSVTVSEVDTSV